MEEVSNLLRVHPQRRPEEVPTLTSQLSSLPYIHISPLSPLPPPYGSVMALPAPQYLAGDVITMRLMAREKVSLELLHTPKDTLHHSPPLRALPTSSPAPNALAHHLPSPLSMVHIPHHMVDTAVVSTLCPQPQGRGL